MSAARLAMKGIGIGRLALGVGIVAAPVPLGEVDSLHAVLWREEWMPEADPETVRQLVARRGAADRGVHPVHAGLRPFDGELALGVRGHVHLAEFVAIAVAARHHRNLDVSCGLAVEHQLEGRCIACGAPLGEVQPSTCANCGFVVQKEEKICPNCKTRLK